MACAHDRIVMEIWSRFESIDLVQALGEELGSLCGFDGDGCFWIGMAVREALNNAVVHGNCRDPSKKVRVAITITREELQVSVRDEGAGFTCDLISNPLKPDNLLKTSGRGIFYIRNFMDRIDFSEADKRGGEIRMFKKRPLQA